MLQGWRGDLQDQQTFRSPLHSVRALVFLDFWRLGTGPRRTGIGIRLQVSTSGHGVVGRKKSPSSFGVSPESLNISPCKIFVLHSPTVESTAHNYSNIIVINTIWQNFKNYANAVSDNVLSLYDIVVQVVASARLFFFVKWCLVNNNELVIVFSFSFFLVGILSKTAGCWNFTETNKKVYYSLCKHHFTKYFYFFSEPLFIL